MSLKKLTMIIASISLTAGLVGCAHKAAPPAKDPSAPLPPQVIKKWHNKLAKSGVQLIQQGWRLTMIIPADHFFTPGTAEIDPDTYHVLHQIAKYLEKYSQHTWGAYPIRVSGYTDPVFSRTDRQELGQQYAQSVASFLWDRGFSHRQLKIVSYGAKDPIASQRTIEGRAFNRRVVIQVH